MANKPEDICVSLETAKALHDAGIVGESYFGWFMDSAGTYIASYPKQHGDYIYPAPTAEELKPIYLNLLHKRADNVGFVHLVYQFTMTVMLHEDKKLCELIAKAILKEKALYDDDQTISKE